MRGCLFYFLWKKSQKKKRYGIVYIRKKNSKQQQQNEVHLINEKKGNSKLKRVRIHREQRYRGGFVLRLTYIYLMNTHYITL